MQQTIRFYYGFQEQTLTFGEGCEYKATDNLLFYLRQVLKAKVTREGCGVGDCGACTVVLGELREGKIIYYPINSCLFMLPSLDGKWLITSDHLRYNGELHPVQQALLEHYGVQCGFCTSGMLMSMFALYKNTLHPSRQIIEDRMTGNLCRCTGYRPILEATRQACTGAPDHFTAHEPQVLRWMEQNRPQEFLYNTNGIVYYRPVKLEDALIWHHREQHSCPACGFSDIAVMHRKQDSKIAHILDLSVIGEMREITATPAGLTIGASVPVEQAREACQEQFPQMYELLGRFASYQIRQVASLSGNIASGSPIGDTLPMLMAHHAILRIARIENGTLLQREVPMNEFITGYKKNVLAHNELIRNIFIPHIPNGMIVRCMKVSNRRSVDIAAVSLSARYRMENGCCREIELYYGGMAERVKRASGAEQALRDHPMDEMHIALAQQALLSDFSPIPDVRATAQRRMELAQNLLEILC